MVLCRGTVISKTVAGRAEGSGMPFDWEEAVYHLLPQQGRDLQLVNLVSL